jgi:hypothetical protein
MNDRKDKNTRTLLWVLFLILFVSSLVLNIALSRSLQRQELVIDHLYGYKKTYFKLIELIGANPEDAERFLENPKKD